MGEHHEPREGRVGELIFLTLMCLMLGAVFWIYVAWGLG